MAPRLIALKTKEGELNALANLAEQDITRITPMIEVLDKGLSEHGRIGPKLLLALARLAEHQRIPWLDVTAVGAGEFDWLDRAAEDAIAARLMLFAPDAPAFIPIIGIDAGELELRAVRRLLDHHEREVVLRVPYGLVRSIDVLRRIRAVATDLGITTDQLHVLLDLGYIDCLSAVGVRTVSQLINQLAAEYSFASCTLLSGSTPLKRLDYGTSIRDRAEVAAWNAISDEVTGTEVRYGDYGTIHPRTSPETTGPKRPPYPFLNYTIPGQSLVLRRQLKKVDGIELTDRAEEFCRIAGELVARPEYPGPGFSWGDGELHRCRPGGDSRAGGSSQWIAMAMSHHMAHLARSDQL
ncbi:hypothetical protein D5S17_26955 [Pseudonocardiaceae bacterium YIM PH 21723]|nr:hypothetical protein D5S17_26955 [Pseudonocardiaceae bacterium YIM PH 21723]